MDDYSFEQNGALPSASWVYGWPSPQLGIGCQVPKPGVLENRSQRTSR